MNESLDIIERLDCGQCSCAGNRPLTSFMALLNELAAPLFKITMPHLVWTKEFNEKSRRLFSTQKGANPRFLSPPLIRDQQQHTLMHC